MKTINKIIAAALIAVIFTSNALATNNLANNDSLTNTVVDRYHVNAQIKSIITEEAKSAVNTSNSEQIIVKMMLDETGKVFELKVFCNNNELKEKLESKFKSVSFKDFQEFTYYYFKVSINKV
jgi:hypothetical protein